MKTWTTLLLLACISTAYSQTKSISVYTFSQDSDAGFNDDHLDIFRRELGKYTDSSIELAYTSESAQVTVQFLGQGKLSVQFGPVGNVIGHTFSPNEKAPKMWAIIRLDNAKGFSKELSHEGSGGRDLSRLAKQTADWIQQNSTRIRELKIKHQQ